MKKARARKWIQRAVKPEKRGALHRQLGIPLGEAIPLAVLRDAARAEGLLGRRARFALNVRGLRRRRMKKSHRGGR